jgi:CubicO group peptidase (beta-lactamase class C family)
MGKRRDPFRKLNRQSHNLLLRICAGEKAPGAAMRSVLYHAAMDLAQTAPNPRFRRIACGIALLAGIASVPALAAEPAPLQGLDGYIAGAMRAWETPGLAIAVVKDGKPVRVKGYGVRRLGGREPVGADTVFAAASVTKTFTTAALALLVDGDRLRWDDRVIDHLPGFRLSDPWVTGEIRIRDLVSHRSGVARGEMLWYYAGFDRAAVMRRLRHLPFRSGFRERFGYQNLMFVAAGELTAAVAGERWGAFLKKRLFKPLGMTNTSTSVGALPKNAATPHARIEGHIEPIEWLNVDNIGPAGGINSTARDLSRWMRLLLGGGELDGKRLLSEARIREMRTPVTPLPVSPKGRARIPETNFRAYGLGWYLEDYRGERLAYHAGRIDGMSARLVLLPEKQLGVAVLTNRGRSSLPAAVAYRVIDAYLSAPKRDWSALLLTWAAENNAARAAGEAEDAARRAGETRPSLPLARYRGRYESALFGTLDIRLDKDRLVLARNASAIADLTHWHFDTFRARFRSPALRDRAVTFTIDRNGHAAALDIAFNGVFRNMQPPLPPDLRIAPPPKATPKRTAALSGVWTGRWSGVMAHTLAVERIDGDRADIVYAWGPAPAWGVTEGGWRRLEARIDGGTLEANLSAAERLRYRIDAKGALAGRYRDGARRREATMTRDGAVRR